ncbi:MAG: hypothetical protein K2V38_13530, partial [Gemmataceae bacterium]|nr:hypothetical protein [Gemmataceae bacterium]
AGAGHMSPRKWDSPVPRRRSVDAAVELMEAGGVKVTQHRDPDAAHLLFFAELGEVTDVIAAWVQSLERGS